MEFVYPSFLWALLLVAVPIIIHILNLRKHQTVYFSNVEFLKRVKKESQRKSKLKQLLILASRILMIVFVVIAFAKPYKPVGFGERRVTGTVVCIYIDNSYSMMAEGPEGIGLESAKQKAYSIVNASQPDTKFALLTNDLSEKHYRFYSKQEIMGLIGEVSESYRQTSLSTILLRFNNLTAGLLKDTNKKTYLLSDFQKSSSDLQNLKTDSLTTYNFVPVLLNSVKNIYIDTCWHETPAHHLEQVEVMNVRVVNSSEEEYYNMPVNLYINDSLKTLGNVDLRPHESKLVTLHYTNKNQGLQQGKIEINDYPIVYDNAIYFSYFVSSSNNTMLIKPGRMTIDTRNFEALFANDKHISLEIVNDDRLQISSLKNYSSIFLYELPTLSSGLIGELVKYVESGGNLTVIPAPSGNLTELNNLLTGLQAATFARIDTAGIPFGEVIYSHPVFAGVFKENTSNVELPFIKKRYRFNDNEQVAETPIMIFSDKTNALTVKTFGKGKLYTFAFPFTVKDNQFSDHLLFIPTIYNIALYASSNQPLYSVLGKDKFAQSTTPLDKVMQNPVLRNRFSKREYIPSVVKQDGSQMQMSIDANMDAGLYTVSIDNEEIGGVAINYNLTESDLACYTPDELKVQVSQLGIKNFNLLSEKNGDLSTAISELNEGKQYWKLFIVLGLLFLIIEASIIRLWDKIF